MNITNEKRKKSPKNGYERYEWGAFLTQVKVYSDTDLDGLSSF